MEVGGGLWRSILAPVRSPCDSEGNVHVRTIVPALHAPAVTNMQYATGSNVICIATMTLGDYAKARVFVQVNTVRPYAHRLVRVRGQAGSLCDRHTPLASAGGRRHVAVIYDPKPTLDRTRM